MVHQQGEKLDVIEEELFTTYKNIEMSNDQLQEANKKHLRSRRKYVTCSLIILLVVGVMAFMILAIWMIYLSIKQPMDLYEKMMISKVW